LKYQAMARGSTSWARDNKPEAWVEEMAGRTWYGNGAKRLSCLAPVPRLRVYFIFR
jgi:hypothetical protein